MNGEELFAAFVERAPVIVADPLDGTEIEYERIAKIEYQLPDDMAAPRAIVRVRGREVCINAVCKDKCGFSSSSVPALWVRRKGDNV